MLIYNRDLKSLHSNKNCLCLICGSYVHQTKVQDVNKIDPLLNYVYRTALFLHRNESKEKSMIHEHYTPHFCPKETRMLYDSFVYNKN
jgi:hypothetical protein